MVIIIKVNISVSGWWMYLHVVLLKNLNACNVQDTAIKYKSLQGSKVERQIKTNKRKLLWLFKRWETGL